MGTVWAGVERFHLAEVIHVLPQAAPVAVSFGALDAAQLDFAAPPDLTWQLVAEGTRFS